MAELKIVGTAHVSQKSVDEVKAAIEEFRPDIVAIELDPARFSALKKQARDPTVEDVLEVRNFNSLLVQWLLSYLQRKIGVDVGVEPGAEMKAAIVEAESHNIPVALVDRDIRLTLMRFWKSMGIVEKIKMVFALIFSIAEIDKGEEIDIESLKDQNIIDAVMEEFRRFSPNGAHALIDERDAFIAHQLVILKTQRPDARILAIVGAGHLQGIANYVERPQTLPPFDTLVKEPKSFPWAKIFGFAVTGLFAFLLAAIAFSGVGWTVLLYALLFWVIIHGVLAALFTLIAGGHPYSALTCFAVAWMTSLNPLLHAGWFAAYVEAKVRKPPVSDFRKIYETESLREMARIPLFKVVLVAALANLGSLLGTILYFFLVFPLLHIDPATVISNGVHNMYTWVTGLI
ncbi:TraB/GumN family protein [Methanoregula sp.]|uniref:TraB/GumN family protein n=1 Tax=Methanoregula sp. TaxID=2052170 RepID=UPI002BCBFA0E|nr:TraB/GumN family protein [Methanoregula sp.]HVP95804.1 TraB/GumN family protein [Methanoregula sp.]